jgi:hypothetical protein
MKDIFFFSFMVIYEHEGRFVASEKLAMERSALEAMTLSFLADFLETQGCEQIDSNLWKHSTSDSLLYLACIPRTKV